MVARPYLGPPLRGQRHHGRSTHGRTATRPTRGRWGCDWQCHWAGCKTRPRTPGRGTSGDGHYVTAVYDASYVNTGVTPEIHGNGLNNATWREINMSNPTASSIPFVGVLDASTNVRQPGIKAWQVIDPSSVVLANADYLDTNITARFIVGAKVTNNGNGTWNYEYAVYNHNADRAGGSFSVPLPTGAVVVTNIGFHDVDSHSGEPYSLVDWTSTVSSNSITWNTETYGTNVNANALRWGTLYNFSFTAERAPNANGRCYRRPVQSFCDGQQHGNQSIRVGSWALPSCRPRAPRGTSTATGTSGRMRILPRSSRASRACARPRHAPAVRTLTRMATSGPTRISSRSYASGAERAEQPKGSYKESVMRKKTCSLSIAAGVAIMAGLGALSPAARAQCVGYSTTQSTGLRSFRALPTSTTTATTVSPP